MAETDFVPYIAFYVRYSLSCSSHFYTLYKSQNVPKNGLLCSLRGLSDLHGLLGLLGLSHGVKKQGQKQDIGGTKIGPIEGTKYM
jgi:hypothetical protein